MGFATLASAAVTSAALLLTAQLTGEPWKPCAFNDRPIACREVREGPQAAEPLPSWREGRIGRAHV